MESDRIKNLLEKYWSCETTLEEEQELRNWFKNQGNPDGFMEEQALFRYYDQAKNLEAEGIEEKDIMQKVKSNHLGQKTETKSAQKQKQVFLPNLSVISKIAAGIVIALAATVMTLRPDLITGEEPAPNVALIKDTFDNPEEAYAETLKALQLISQKMNVGRKQTAKIGIYNEAEDAIKEEIIN